MKKRAKAAGAMALVIALLGWGSLAQTSQNVRVTLVIPQPLFIAAVIPSITAEITLREVEGPQPFKIGDWHVNIDALTPYRLNSSIVTIDTNIFDAGPEDFLTDCDFADDFGECTDRTSLSEPDPQNRRGSGQNTAGLDGADFMGEIFLDIRSWDVSKLPGFYIGVILFTTTDITP
ncbi:MAG: hypothetical protein NZ930_00375 [Candidatus Bipolaricaulota bacterium]|nr:hypothetical protein [Candidatus Bipolaricaulota bacterium]MDW8031159.1 hypothetical protein [Candidatus Bipolaricaulota bacterium]